MYPPWLVLCLSGVERVSGEWGQRSGLTVFLYETLRGDHLEGKSAVSASYRGKSTEVRKTCLRILVRFS